MMIFSFHHVPRSGPRWQHHGRAIKPVHSSSIGRATATARPFCHPHCHRCRRRRPPLQVVQSVQSAVSVATSRDDGGRGWKIFQPRVSEKKNCFVYRLRLRHRLCFCLIRHPICLLAPVVLFLPSSSPCHPTTTPAPLHEPPHQNGDNEAPVQYRLYKRQWLGMVALVRSLLRTHEIRPLNPGLCTDMNWV